MPESAIAETASPEESGGTEAPRTETFRHTGQGMFYDSDLSPYYTPYTFLTIHAVDGSVVDVSQGY